MCIRDSIHTIFSHACEPMILKIVESTLSFVCGLRLIYSIIKIHTGSFQKIKELQKSREKRKKHNKFIQITTVGVFPSSIFYEYFYIVLIYNFISLFLT